MFVINLLPTANQSPDPGQGGDAVNTPTNTGHADTTAVGDGDGVTSETFTCKWSSFQSLPGGQILSIKLKIEHSSNGVRNGVSTANSFILSYSLDGGSNWTNAVARSNFTGLQSGTFSVDLSLGQNISQVQVRDQITATAVVSGQSANASATISNIRLEVQKADSQLIVLM